MTISNIKSTSSTTKNESISFVLAIETSCDETAIAILKKSKKSLEIMTNQVSSQVKLHAKWGGVVPNLAAREHVKNFPKLLKMALDEAKITPDKIDLIATTNGPGLIPALMVGVNYAKTLSYLWEKPLLGIHHIEGHIYANFVGISNSEFRILNKNTSIKTVKEDTPSIIQNSKLPLKMVGLDGLEPSTSRLSVVCSSQLSYRPIHKVYET